MELWLFNRIFLRDFVCKFNQIENGVKCSFLRINLRGYLIWTFSLHVPLWKRNKHIICTIENIKHPRWTLFQYTYHFEMRCYYPKLVWLQYTGNFLGFFLFNSSDFQLAIKVIYVVITLRWSGGMLTIRASLIDFSSSQQ